MDFVCVLLCVRGLNDYRPGKIRAEHSQEKEFPFGFHFREFRQIFAQRPLGQEVREKRRHAARYRARGSHDSTRRALERETERWPLQIVDVVLLKRKQLTLTRKPRDDTD